MRNLVKLSDLFRIGSSKRVLKSQWQNKGVPFYRGREITKLSKNGSVDNELFISESLYSEYATKYGVPNSGDIVITAIGTIGNSYIVQDGDRFYFKDASVLWLKKTTDVSSEFINLWLKSPFMKDQLDEGNGATVDTLTIKKLQGLSVELPPLSEQKRIVAILDQAFADIDQARANAEQNLKNTRELFESYLQQVFSQRGEGWKVYKMSDPSILKMIDGDRGKNYPKKSDFSTIGHCLFLSTKNVRPNGFKFSDVMFITEERDNLLRKGKLERNDVLLTTRGTIGNIALFDDSVEYENIRINSGMLILRPNTKVIHPSFLFEIMRSSIVKQQILEKTSGAAQPQLPIQTLNTFEFPIPELLDEQLKIVIKLKALEQHSNKLHSIYIDKLASLDELKKSILQKAFTGELTDTNHQTSKEAVA